MPGKKADLYVNQAVITVTETAANTLTFKKLETGISLFEKVAWLIERVEYFFSSYSLLVASADAACMALATTDQMSSMALTNAAILDLYYLLRFDLGAAANAELLHLPMVKDFSQMSGGGILVAPNPIYLGIQGTSVASAMSVTAKIFYTTVPLSPDEYWELVESRRIISA